MAFEGFTQVLTSILNYLNPYSESFLLRSVLNYLNPYSESFLLKIAFVPREDFFSDKVEEFKGHFLFIDTFVDFVGNFTNMSRRNEAPSISVDFSKAESQYNYGGKATALSLAWYSRYKPIGDVVITAFVYAFFIWRFYCRLPEIISGSGIIIASSSVDMSDVKEGKYKKKW